jgi:hypothetical protein
VRVAVGALLTGLFRQGAFAGQTIDEAYFVRCDRTTMTQTDLELGNLNIEVGFAPLKPAEFIVIRISQKLGAIATEIVSDSTGEPGVELRLPHARGRPGERRGHGRARGRLESVELGRGSRGQRSERRVLRDGGRRERGGGCDSATASMEPSPRRGPGSRRRTVTALARAATSGPSRSSQPIRRTPGFEAKAVARRLWS